MIAGGKVLSTAIVNPGASMGGQSRISLQCQASGFGRLSGEPYGE
jgi:hypothetical protein